MTDERMRRKLIRAKRYRRQYDRRMPIEVFWAIGERRFSACMNAAYNAQREIMKEVCKIMRGGAS